MVESVVSVLGTLAVGVDQGNATTTDIVFVLRQASFRPLDRGRIAPRVIGEAGGIAEWISAALSFTGGIVGVAGLLVVAIGFLQQVALGIILPAEVNIVPVGAAFRQAELLVPYRGNELAGVGLLFDVTLRVVFVDGDVDQRIGFGGHDVVRLALVDGPGHQCDFAQRFLDPERITEVVEGVDRVVAAQVGNCALVGCCRGIGEVGLDRSSAIAGVGNTFDHVLGPERF